jgi:hypothetical protein
VPMETWHAPPFFAYQSTQSRLLTILMNINKNWRKSG